MKNISAGWDPADAAVWILFAELEPDKRFSGSGRVENCSLAAFPEHLLCSGIRCLIMWEKLDCHVIPLRPIHYFFAVISKNYNTLWIVYHYLILKAIHGSKKVKLSLLKDFVITSIALRIEYDDTLCFLTGDCKEEDESIFLAVGFDIKSKYQRSPTMAVCIHLVPLWDRWKRAINDTLLERETSWSTWGMIPEVVAIHKYFRFFADAQGKQTAYFGHRF